MLAHSAEAKTLYFFNNPKTNAIEWTDLSALFILWKYFQRKPFYVVHEKAFIKVY